MSLIEGQHRRLGLFVGMDEAREIAVNATGGSSPEMFAMRYWLALAGAIGCAACGANPGPPRAGIYAGTLTCDAMTTIFSTGESLNKQTEVAFSLEVNEDGVPINTDGTPWHVGDGFVNEEGAVDIVEGITIADNGATVTSSTELVLLELRARGTRRAVVQFRSPDVNFTTDERLFVEDMFGGAVGSIFRVCSADLHR